ncbi:MAG: hypothetical protein R3C28_24780 [Pirellulaceae bacterium]
MLEKSVDRRSMLKLASASLVGLPWLSFEVNAKQLSKSAVQQENEQPGTKDWLLNNTRIDPDTKYRCPWVEGFRVEDQCSCGRIIADVRRHHGIERSHHRHFFGSAITKDWAVDE